jgi:flagellar assembly protein FliH
MSLSNTTESNVEHGKLWKKFKMESFNSPSQVKERKEPLFVSLQAEDLEKADFIPYEESGDKYKNGRKAKDFLKKAEDALKESKEKASLIEQEGYEKGFVQGEIDGLEFGKKEAVKVVENIESLLNGFSQIRTEIIKGYEKEILELIFSITERIINYKINSDETIVRETALKALRLAPEKGNIILRVNPEDFDYIEKVKPDFFTEFKELKSIKIVSDSSIGRGGCLLETQYGEVDARITIQLEKIFQTLEGVFTDK